MRTNGLLQMYVRLMSSSTDSLLGTIVTYKFTSETHDNQGNINLKFARFKSLRLDKDEPNFEN